MKKQKKGKAEYRIQKTGHLSKYLVSVVIGLFLAGALWIQDNVKETRFPASEKPVELYANQTEDNLTKTFTSAIGSAKKSVLLTVYSLTDPQIIASLRTKSQQGVDVRVICDAKASPYIDSKLGPHIHTTRRFGPGLMHQKILVIDGSQSWIGSANMTTESLRMHGNLVAGIDHPAFASTLTSKANTMTIEGETTPFPYQTFLMGGQKVELWFLPDNKNAIHRLKDLIRSAQKTIRIAMFTWTRHDLAQEVINATRRGVKTEVVIDHYSGKGASAKVVKLLSKNGINIRLSSGGPLLHHKFLYIDGNLLVNGSANWTRAAFKQNDDCFLVIHNLTPRQTQQMDTLWSTIADDAIKSKDERTE